jgi:hypothetical protein
MHIRPVFIAFFVVISATLVAQVRQRPTETGPWRPWSFTAIASARESRAATAADVKAFEGRLQELAAIVKRAPAVATPIGFAAELWGSLSGYDRDPAPGQPPGKAVPLGGVLSFGAFPLIEYQRGGKLVNEDMKGGETELLQFVVNQLDASVYGGSGKPSGWGAASIDAFVEPAAGAALAGLPRFGDAFILKKNPKPLWVPFPIADALAPIVTARREIYESRRDNYAKAVAEFTEWKTPAKRAARRADWKKSAAQMPAAQAAEFLANMEKTDPQLEAANEARLGPGGTDEKEVRAAEREFKEVEGIVAALSPEARRGPSCYDQRANKLADQFRAVAGAPASCRPLVRPNADYYDPKLPRTAPQVVMLATTFTRCLRPEVAKSTSRGGCVINRQLVDAMDWDAVRAWLDR